MRPKILLPDSAPRVAKSYISEYPLIFDKQFVLNTTHNKSILKFMIHLSFRIQ